MKKTVDYLIVGQGLAGSLLAFELIKQGFKIAIIDNGLPNASKIAAGLINPVTGMRLVKSTDIDVLLPIAQRYYRQLSIFFQQEFYVEMPMKRILTTDKLLKNAQKRLQEEEYQPYLSQIKDGFLEQKQTGYLLTVPLLAALKQFFIQQQCYEAAVFNYNDLTLVKGICYQQIKAKKVIFCEGHLAGQNPWFSALPFQFVKGEILTLKSILPLDPSILNYGYWMIPLNDNRFRTGATFDRETINTQATIAAKTLLLTKLHLFAPNTFGSNCLQHEANIRPCTLDKQPFIGLHSQHSQLGIFNGFGAKGSLQIPYYGQQFVQNLSTNKPLSTRVNINRYRF
jgi:glycine/D-amino acid oxidase-like deaminating enzyme